MANSFLLPMHYLQTKNVKIRSKFFNEKYLILMLLVISIMTIFIILMNLPSDMQRLVNRQKIQNVFLPEIPKGNILIPHIDHQHPAPPYYEMNKNLEKPKKTPPKEAEPLGDKLAKNNEYELKITQKRNKIKEVLKYFLFKIKFLIANKNRFYSRWLYLVGQITKSLPGVRMS